MDRARINGRIIMEQTLFENFLDYCKQDNVKLAEDVKTWLSDYFDIKHRICPMSDEELSWIGENLTPESQVEILGKVITFMEDKTNA